MDAARALAERRCELERKNAVSAADVEDYIFALEIQPRLDFRRELGDERCRGLVGLGVVSSSMSWGVAAWWHTEADQWSSWSLLAAVHIFVREYECER